MTTAQRTESDNLFAAIEDDREAASQYLSIFIDEARTTVDELIESLLGLENGGGRKNVEQLFISAHRLKGSAASIGLNRVAKLAHLMEDLLQTLVDRGCTPTPEITDAMLSCTDGFRQYVNGLSEGHPADDAFPSLANKLLAARDTFVGAKPQDASTPNGNASTKQDCHEVTKDAPTAIASAAAGLPEDLLQRLATTVHAEEDDNLLVGRVVFEPGLALAGLKARLIFEKLSNLGVVRHFDPPAEGIDAIETLDSLVFVVGTKQAADAVRRMVWVAGIQDATITVLTLPSNHLEANPSLAASTTDTSLAAGSATHGKVEAATDSSQHPKADTVAKPAETMRVDIARLDELMNLAGQLAIGKARVSQVGEVLKKAIADKNFLRARDGIGDLFEALHQLDLASDGIQQGVMNMRMLPIGPLFGRFHRVIRDLTRTNGKNIRLEIAGEGTELDKRMIDELCDPMIHIVRNAADHGIESPEVREAAGKPRQGVISLAAFHRGSNIVIRVSDDGRGLDVARIRQKAIDRGLVSAADADRMTPREIQQFIWLPGLSTAETVTEVSGRGVGMDIVRSKIEELNGSVEIDSELGRGTTLTIKLPLTLAILPSLMVEIDSDVFAVPMESVVEIVRVDAGHVNTVQGRRMAGVRDRVVPILTLGGVFRWRRGNNKNNTFAETADSTTLVVIGEGREQLGLAVERVLGEEDVVIKSIADNYRNIAGIAGASIMGDGRVSLILDPHALVEMSSRFGLAAAHVLETSS